MVSIDLQGADTVQARLGRRRTWCGVPINEIATHKRKLKLVGWMTKGPRQFPRPKERLHNVPRGLYRRMMALHHDLCSSIFKPNRKSRLIMFGGFGFIEVYGGSVVNAVV
jgi:hypothetical protein